MLRQRPGLPGGRPGAGDDRRPRVHRRQRRGDHGRDHRRRRRRRRRRRGHPGRAGPAPWSPGVPARPIARVVLDGDLVRFVPLDSDDRADADRGRQQLLPAAGRGQRPPVRRAGAGLRRAGHDVLVLTASYEDAPAREERDGLRIVRLPAAHGAADRLSVSFDIAFTAAAVATRAVPQLLDEFRPDVIHQHGQFFDLTWATGCTPAGAASRACCRCTPGWRTRTRATTGSSAAWTPLLVAPILAGLPAADRRHGRADGRVHRRPATGALRRAGCTSRWGSTRTACVGGDGARGPRRGTASATRRWSSRSGHVIPLRDRVDPRRGDADGARPACRTPRLVVVGHGLLRRLPAAGRGARRRPRRAVGRARSPRTRCPTTSRRPTSRRTTCRATAWARRPWRHGGRCAGGGRGAARTTSPDRPGQRTASLRARAARRLRRTWPDALVGLLRYPDRRGERIGRSGRSWCGALHDGRACCGQHLKVLEPHGRRAEPARRRRQRGRAQGGARRT